MSAAEKKSYPLLREALLKRFTLVHVQAVQGALFHDRSQKLTETIDEYALELQKLYRRAYPKMYKEGGEGEVMLTLTTRFISGLRKEVKKGMSTAEGTFDQVLAKVRYKEAQWRELKSGVIEKTPHHEKPCHPPREQRKGAPPRREKDGVQCYKCGAYGHYARSCPLAGRSQPRENQGRVIVQFPDTV